MLKIFSALFAFGFVFTVPLSAATAETKTAPETDGCLIDTDNDGIVDKVIAVRTDGEAREAISGKLWKQNRKAVFEFKLPEVDKPVKKATLKLFLNGKFGCHPDKEGASGPETDLYYYLSPEADGKIELVDDNGVKLGAALPGKPVESVRKADHDRRDRGGSGSRRREVAVDRLPARSRPLRRPTEPAGAGAPPNSPKPTASSSVRH